MAELTNDQLLVSRSGTVLSAGDLRLTPPLEGAFAYSVDETTAEYAATEGARLLSPGEGVDLEGPDLEYYALIDVNSGTAYSTDAGWQVIDYPQDDENVIYDPTEAAVFASSHSLGTPGAPTNWNELKSAPFESAVTYPA